MHERPRVADRGEDPDRVGGVPGGCRGVSEHQGPEGGEQQAARGLPAEPECPVGRGAGGRGRPGRGRGVPAGGPRTPDDGARRLAAGRRRDPRRSPGPRRGRPGRASRRPPTNRASPRAAVRRPGPVRRSTASVPRGSAPRPPYRPRHDPGPAEAVPDARAERRIPHGAPGEGGIDVRTLGPGHGQALGLVVAPHPSVTPPGQAGVPGGVCRGGRLRLPGLAEAGTGTQPPPAPPPSPGDDHRRPPARSHHDHPDHRPPRRGVPRARLRPRHRRVHRARLGLRVPTDPRGADRRHPRPVPGAPGRRHRLVPRARGQRRVAGPRRRAARPARRRHARAMDRRRRDRGGRRAGRRAAALGHARPRHQRGRARAGPPRRRRGALRAAAHRPREGGRRDGRLRAHRDLHGPGGGRAEPRRHAPVAGADRVPRCRPDRHRRGHPGRRGGEPDELRGVRRLVRVAAGRRGCSPGTPGAPGRGHTSPREWGLVAPVSRRRRWSPYRSWTRA